MDQGASILARQKIKRRQMVTVINTASSFFSGGVSPPVSEVAIFLEGDWRC